MCDCTWKIEGSCDSLAKDRELFFGNGYIKVPICDKHYRQHENIIALYKKEKSVDDVIDMTDEERLKELNKFVKFDPLVLMLEEMKLCANDAKELAEQSEELKLISMKKCVVQIINPNNVK